MKLFSDEAEFPGEPAGGWFSDKVSVPEYRSTLIRCIMDIYKIDAMCAVYR